MPDSQPERIHFFFSAVVRYHAEMPLPGLGANHRDKVPSRSAFVSDQSSVPNVLFNPCAVFNSPDARIAKSVGDTIEFRLRHIDVTEPSREIPRLNMIHLANEFDSLIAAHQSRPNVFANMVRAA